MLWLSADHVLDTKMLQTAHRQASARRTNGTSHCCA